MLAFRLRREYFLPSKAYARGRDGLPNQDVVNGRSKAMATGTVPIQGHLDPGIQQVKR